ncbi:hypothetical protein DRE_00423 [Drechslerella stenobrocha 248]|uniref:Uncharacterized protein n=1 Tax=Drechslerella stenobrocha 248 TaxID=1043628 RepID=W7IEP0_9PEZI|nr:hypothetical protein DRE_00423 [Drechslerella stenobrocha 248]
MPCTVTAFPFFDLYEDSISWVLPFQTSEDFWRARFRESVNEEYAILRVAQIYRAEAGARQPASADSVIERLRRSQQTGTKMMDTGREMT